MAVFRATPAKILLLPKIEDMKQILLYTIVSLIFLMSACGPSEEDRARVKVEQAKNLLGQQDTLNALATLDSIPVLFPKAAYQIAAAGNLAKDVRFEVLHQKENQLDSMKQTISDLQKNFVTEKTEFDRYTQYVHKRQTFQRAWNRSYIQIHLDERGEIYLSSNYYGENWLDHTGIRVYDSGEDAKTETVPIGSPDNHRSDFMDSKWEKVSYRNGKSDALIEFIASHVDRNLKAVFLGKEYYYILLEKYDKEAVRDALALSKAIKKSTRLEREIDGLKKKLNIQ